MACIVPLYPSSEALPREYLTPYHRSLIAPDRYLWRKNSPLTGADYNGQGRLGVQPTGLVLDVPARVFGVPIERTAAVKFISPTVSLHHEYPGRKPRS